LAFVLGLGRPFFLVYFPRSPASLLNSSNSRVLFHADARNVSLRHEVLAQVTLCFPITVHSAAFPFLFSPLPCVGSPPEDEMRGPFVPFVATTSGAPVTRSPCSSLLPSFGRNSFLPRGPVAMGFVRKQGRHLSIQ